MREAPSQPLTHFGKGDVTHRWPEFLPGGKAVLFAAGRSGITLSNAQIAVQSIGTGERRDLIQGGTNPRYAPSGHLVYAQGGSLIAVPFDPQRLEAKGTAVPVVEGVMQSPTREPPNTAFPPRDRWFMLRGASRKPEQVGLGQSQWSRAAFGGPAALTSSRTSPLMDDGSQWRS